MPSPPTSLFWITLVAVVAPLAAGLVPRRLVPEVVLLLGLGIVIGPFGANLAAEGDAIDAFSELGLGLLFLLAGFEIDPDELTGRAGRRAGLTWVLCFGVALALSGLLHTADLVDARVALAIALTSTALGTLLPILKDSGPTQGAVGSTVLRHGAYGELGPILAISLFLGTRGPLTSLVLLLVFAALVCVLAVPSVRLRGGTHRLLELIRHGAETTGQVPVRMTVLLLVTLGVAAHLLELDVVLGAFAAGFILRLALPEGDERFETRIEAIAFGLLVPIFFVTSGMSIDPAAIVNNPLGFVGVVALILLARGLPVYVVTRHLGPQEERLTIRESAAVALFAATGLPILVAVASVSVAAGAMTGQDASVLIAAGAATVLLCPMLATLLLHRPVGAAGQPPGRGQ